MKTNEKFIYIFFVALFYLHLCASTFAQSLWEVNPNEYEHSMTITCVVVNESSTYFQEDITIGSLTPGLGYQIKLSEQINQFNFCN